MDKLAFGVQNHFTDSKKKKQIMNSAFQFENKMGMGKVLLIQCIGCDFGVFS